MDDRLAFKCVDPSFWKEKDSYDKTQWNLEVDGDKKMRSLWDKRMVLKLNKV